jgi:hypothetical protein
MQLLAGVPLVVLSLALAAPAFAEAACDPLDVTCVVTDTAGSGQQTVSDNVDTVIGTVKPVVDDPQGTVDHILHGISRPPVAAAAPAAAAVAHRRHASSPAAGTAGWPGGTGPHVVRPQQPRSVGGQSAGSHPTGSTPDTSSTPVTVAKAPLFAHGFAGVAAHVVAPSLGVVLALLAVAVGFVMVQDRLDRRDPKLTLAPVQTEMMGFS